MKHYLDAAEKAARAAGKLLRKNFGRPQRVNAVAAHDIKLQIDIQTQELITKLLLKEFPKHALYGEEGIVGDQSSEHQWIVDPLDGTVNYFYGIPHFCVSIALRLRNEVIFPCSSKWFIVCANAECSAALRSTWLMSRADDSTLTLSRELVCGI